MQSQKPSGLSDKGKLSLKDTHIRRVDFVFPESIYLKMLEVNFFLLQHENKWIWSLLQLSSFSRGWRGCLFGPVACPPESGEKAAAYITWEDSL